MKYSSIISSLLYLIVILLILILGTFSQKRLMAGQIRNLDLNDSKPAIVKVAFGRTTAISFSVKPEKVVAGSPESVEINFLGKDITIRPLGESPGNIIVYTSTGRYVILLLLVNNPEYDDVVNLILKTAYKKISLPQVTYKNAKICLIKNISNKNECRSITKELNVKIRGDGKRIESEELKKELSELNKLICEGSKFNFKDNSSELNFITPFKEVNCTFSEGTILLKRRN